MSMDDHGHRDEALGAALAQLDVPEHREGFFAELERSLGREHEPRTQRRLLVPSIALAAAAAAAIAIAIVLPRLTAAEPARASDVAERVSAALAETGTVRGRIAYTFGGETTRQWFVVDSAGNLRLTSADGATDLVFDAGRGTERAITTSASLGTGRFYALRLGLAPGPPDPTRSDFPLARELGAVARALAAAGDARARTGRLDGRDVWLLDVSVRPNTISPDADRITATVERSTGFPLRVRTMLEGELRSELRLEELIVDEPSADAFELRFPEGAEVLRTDAGFRSVGLADAGRVAGHEPLVPARLPEGFTLATAAASERGVISLAYRRGFEQVTVTTRRHAADAGDPFAVAGIEFERERVVVGGRVAELVLDPRTVPHVWWTQGDLVVTVGGDLARAELLAVASSLE